MRLWHVDLLEVLPHQQLVSQWRECCCIAANLKLHGSPRHMLVNKLLNYNVNHFIKYCEAVKEAMQSREYTVNDEPFNNCMNNIIEAYHNGVFKNNDNNPDKLFDGWFNDRYLLQCICNLQEKYDCGGIPEYEWWKVEPVLGELMKRLCTDKNKED